MLILTGCAFIKSTYAYVVWAQAARRAHLSVNEAVESILARWTARQVDRDSCMYTRTMWPELFIAPSVSKSTRARAHTRARGRTHARKKEIGIFFIRWHAAHTYP